MAENATPQPELVHETPSLPSSPLPKRTKYTEPAPNIVAGLAQQNEAQSTPTPQTAILPDPIASMATQPVNTLPPLSAPQTLPSIPPLASEPLPQLQVKLLSPDAKPPTRSSAFAAGYDLYASKEATIPSWGKALVDTDISIAVPAGTYGRVAPRSGLASKHSIDVGAGVIDADYRGPVKVLLFNLSQNDFKVEQGDRIAQLIVERVRGETRTYVHMALI
jgi:dUTP pyrophosphatase